MRIRYTNQAITTEQQIDILIERGLLIDDVKQAIEVLDTISYFRLAGYWKHFESDHTTHLFKEGCRFSDIVDLYSFDKQWETNCGNRRSEDPFPSIIRSGSKATRDKTGNK